MATIQFLGAAGTVTGSCYLLESATAGRILLECGMHQGGDAVERIRVVETKGDTSEIVLTVKSIRRVYSPAEKERLFGLKETSPPPRQ